MKSPLKLLLRYTLMIAREREFSKARVFFLRSFLFFPHTIKWLKFIDSFYKKHGFNYAPWNMVVLPVRTYVSSALNIKQKISLLINHYKILEEKFYQGVLSNLLIGKEIRFCTLNGKDGKSLYFNIAILEKYYREGGLTIFISDDENIISSLTFSFSIDEFGKKFIFIGGLQGTVAGKEKIVSSTRNLRGLRPKYALLDCCYSFASIFGIDYLIGVSNKNHIFSKDKNYDKINSNYDGFWEELNGIKNNKLDFDLPKELAKRNFEEVQQKKRKDWLARQEYLKQLKSGIIESFRAKS